MMLILPTLLMVTLCSCQVNFNSGPRTFALELIHFSQLQQNGHVVISPFGIWSLMSGVALGTGGETYEQLRKAFVLPWDTETLINVYKSLTQIVLDPMSKGISLTSNNFVFLDDDFDVRKSYQNIMKDVFGTAISTLNFKDPDTAAKIANDLIQHSSSGISNVLTPEDFTQSKMILSNIITFKGLWSSPFNESDTALAPFTDEKGNVVGQVRMMYQRAEFPFSNARDIKAFVLELPYGTDNKYSMLILLPHPKVTVADVYKKLNIFGPINIFNKLQDDLDYFGLQNIDVYIPRFKISTNVVLNRPLNDMGVYDMFDSNYANFSRITNERIFVSAVVHKADIEVTESGTLATAATTAVLTDRIPPPIFKADRPFIYFIVEKKITTVIFGGIYSKPSVF